MPLKDRRVQIPIEYADHQRLERIAHADHRSVASVIREAIVHYLNNGADDQARALEALLALPVDSGAGEDWNDAKQSLEDARTRRSPLIRDRGVGDRPRG